MKAASLSDLKKELQQIPQKELIDLCLNLAKYKKDNKVKINRIFIYNGIFLFNRAKLFYIYNNNIFSVIYNTKSNGDI